MRRPPRACHAAARIVTSALLLGGCYTWSVGQDGKGGVSCSADCYEQTDYADRCVDFAKQQTWCTDLLESHASDFAGFASGKERLGCGCWGAVPGPYALRDPTCRSRAAVATPCPTSCMGGGFAYHFVCT